MAGLATSLQLRTAQTLAMTPQLQQAIRLLQLSAIELRQELRTAVDQNPMLELDDSDQSASNMESIEELRDREDSHDDYDLFDNDSSVNMNDLAMQNAPDLREEEPVRRDEPKADTDFSEPSYSAGTRSRGMAIDDDSVYEGETTESLQDHLMWQLNLSPLSGTDRKVAEFVIDGINDSGYLTTTDEEILSFAQKLDPEYTAQDVSSVIKLIQHYDPTGVGSRNAREFLRIQLQALPDDTRYLHQALKMVDEYFELLVNHDFRGLCQKMSIKEEVLGEITRLIRSLKPRPATGQVTGKSDFVIPDVLTYRRDDGTYAVELNPDSLPKVRINDRYRALADQARTERDRTFFKNNLQDANWLLQSLNKRNETLLKVARCIVEHQHDFLERGESHMHPMILNDVA